MNEMQNILVVGAGFAGSVLARILAESGTYRITVIDKRNHVAGNAYDPVDKDTGVRFHKYGPHIFHTNNEQVVDFLSRFTGWIKYKHRVKAYVENTGAVPLPINIDTINALYDQSLKTRNDMVAFLDKIRCDIKAPANAREHLLSIYGEELTELFFSRYTKKMWDLDLSDLPVSVVSRLPVRYDNTPYYFNDKYQMMPESGYIRLFENMLDHENISLHLNTEFDKAMEREYLHVFNSMPIDVYYDNVYGPLPYRSIKFTSEVASEFMFDVPTVNLTDTSADTRLTNWSLYPGHGGGEQLLITRETPCSYEDNDFERYYPVKSLDDKPAELYEKYRLLSGKQDNITFIGRCGQYIYYDMHQVVANSMKIAEKFMNTSTGNG